MTFWQKLLGLVIVLIIYTAGVWHIHTWYDGYKNEKAAEIATDKAQKGENNIIEFHQKIEKVYVKVKDDCLNKPVPDSISRLLK